MFRNENTLLRGSSTYGMPISNAYNQRSFYHRIETSPMSLKSAPDFEQHNYYNGRGRRSQTPDSVGSMDSTTSAAYVVQIFKNMKFNEYDKKIINEAYNKYFRNRGRRRIGKRRKLKLFLKHNRRKSGDDSGDDGSNSSMSSDDNRSVRSAIPKESILRPSNRSNRTEILNFRTTMKDSNMYKDCTQNFKHTTLKNMFMLPSQRFNTSVARPISERSIMPLNAEASSLPHAKSFDNTDSENEDIFPNQTIRENTLCRKRSLENDAILPIEKRNKLCFNNTNTVIDDVTFKKPQMPIRRQMKAKQNFISEQNISKSQLLINNIGHSFLSQSLNQDRLNISHSNRKLNGFLNIRNTVQYNKKIAENNSKQVDTDSDRDEIITHNTLSNNNSRNNLSHQTSQPNHKITKQIDNRDKNNGIITSPMKTKTNKSPNIKINNTNKKELKESSKKQGKEKRVDIPTEDVNAEKLISKSSQPLVGNVEIINTIPSDNNQLQSKQANTEKGDNINTSEMPLSTSDVSMKPSFIKRKLFTQKLDIIEDKNSSVDCPSTNSPQTRNYRSREKNKVRKLASSQSCLNRDVLGENNILDLIHKIVPADQINMTSASQQRAKKSNCYDDKWDVVSVLSMCDGTNESDTFTDEEIFNVNRANKNQTNNKCKKTVEKPQCKVVVEKLEKEAIDKIQNKPDVTQTNCTTKRTVASCVRSFWDTDFETDVEDERIPIKPPANTLGQIKETEASQTNRTATKNYESIPKPKDTTLSSIRNRFNNTFLRKFPLQASEKKSLNNCEVEASASKLTKDKNVQENSMTGRSRRAIKNVTAKNETKSINTKELKNNTSDLKLLEEKNLSNIKTQKCTKSVETNEVNKVTTKNDTRLLNKNELKKPTRNNTTLIQEENKTENKPQRKRTQKLKEATSLLNDTLNSSMFEHSILTRSLRLKNKSQLNGKTLYESRSPKPKSITKNTPKRTPNQKLGLNNKQATRTTPKRTVNRKLGLNNKQATKTTPKRTQNHKLGCNNKQLTKTMTKRTTPSRKAKEKKTEFSKLNESAINTRNRSFNTSLRVQLQQRNVKKTK